MGPVCREITGGNILSQKAGQFYSKLKIFWEGLDNAGDEPAEIALSFLNALSDESGSDSALVNLAAPFRDAVSVLHTEFDNALKSDRKAAFEKLEAVLDGGVSSPETVAETLWAAFFPEALYLDTDPDKQIRLLREKRIVNIEELAKDPITNPADEIIFTSNVLLSPPDSVATNSDLPEESAAIIEGARQAGKEDQLYWYDHPIPVGTAIANDEAMYGLAGLADTLNFEKNRGTAASDARIKVLLSVSVTHAGLHGWALPWLRSQFGLSDRDQLAGLDVFAFTENDSTKVIDMLEPWLSDPSDLEALRQTFGVDGEYGRHYSFLKALPALWGILSDGKSKATFKIDLDQVFPQEELSAETGKSAFEHFNSPLWGARAKDSDGKDVELGMIAGGLVNEKDIHAGLFTPDIPWPAELPEGENLFFFKQRPMAVSTRAELMTRYTSGQSPDGKTQALQRIHVTGGTNGIRFDALRRYRPFTPSFIGRAEDQGYILSVLSGLDDGSALRYAHASGLIMRHDKEAFAGDAVKAGKAGSYVGDLIRLFVFSAYAGFLPGGAKVVKSTVDPFTGCFITPIPATLALLRLALHLISVEGGSTDDRADLLKLAGRRLPEWISNGKTKAEELKQIWYTERRAWNAYYDALDNLEKALADANPKAGETRNTFKKLLSDCRISAQE